jgi:hypothetical protein
LAQLALPAPQAHRARRAFKVLLVLWARKVHQDFKAQRGLRERWEKRVK